MGNYNFELDLDSKNTMSIINSWINKDSKILEFGPANGRLTRYLQKEKSCRMTIVEFDEMAGKQAAQFAEKKFLGTEFGNIENFYWYAEKDKFDYIIFADVLEHLRIPREVLAKCKDMLKPNGKILVSIPNVTHNSIIIGMMKDRFDYADTGLLDSTHIHFFTQETFCEMVSELGYSINKIEPIYSRVGDNEIDASYADVPVEVERYLRKRIPGNIYQYVFELETDNAQEESGNRIEVQGLWPEYYTTLEAQIFGKNLNFEYDDERRITKKYFECEDVIFEADLKNLKNPDIICLTPMEWEGVMLLKEAILTTGSSKYTLKVKQTDAHYFYGNLFVFTEKFSGIEFDVIPKEFQNGKVRISFKILNYRIEKQDCYRIADVLDMQKSEGKKEATAQMKEMQGYVEHLETDVSSCKATIREYEAAYRKTFKYKLKRLINLLLKRE